LDRDALNLVDRCVRFSCGRARMKLYYLPGERIGGSCVAYRFTGIYLDGTLAHTHRTRLFDLSYLTFSNIE